MGKQDTSNNQKDFTQQIQAAQDRFQQLCEQAEQQLETDHGLLKESLFELSIALEELHVAAEEIQEQNDNLAMAHYALAAERQRYQELFEFAPDAYLVTDRNGLIQELNQAAALLLQRQSLHLVDKPLAVFVHEQDRSAFRRKLNQLSQLQPDEFTELQPLQDWQIHLQTQMGERFPCAIALSAVRNPQHELIGFRWLLRDITLQKQVEAELHRVVEREQHLNSWKSRIINTVAHEYRGPLNVIALATNILKSFNPKLPEDQKIQFFDKIQANVKHLTNLADDMLTHSQAASDKLAFNPTPLNLEQFCHELVETLKLTIGHEHTLNFITQGDCSNVCIDEKLLRQVLGNLLSNAIKYSPQGGMVHFELIRQDERVIFQIQDSGIGIFPDDQAKLFEPFHRGKNVGTIAGTGMGLAIAKKAIDLHDGEICIESSIGVGTMFQVSLPLNPALGWIQRRDLEIRTL